MICWKESGWIKKDVRQALTIINEVSEDVKNGKCYILFPEGGYDFLITAIMSVTLKPAVLKLH